MIERPDSVPAEGQIEAFDAGWAAHEVGIERNTVLLLTPDSGVGWAVLGWDAREILSRQQDG